MCALTVLVYMRLSFAGHPNVLQATVLTMVANAAHSASFHAELLVVVIQYRACKSSCALTRR